MKLSNSLRKFCFLGGCCFTAMNSTSWGEEAQHIPATGAIRFMSWEHPKSTALFISSDGVDFHPVHAPVYRFGRPSEIEINETLSFYQQKTGDGDPEYKLIAETILPTGAVEFRSYLMQTGDSENEFEVLLLPDDVDQFPAGEVRLVNFSKLSINLRLGNENSFILKPLEYKQVSVTPDIKYRVKLGTSLSLSEGVETLKMLSVRPDHRAHVTILHTAARLGPGDAISGSPRTRVLTESEYVPLTPVVSVSESEASGTEEAP